MEMINKIASVFLVLLLITACKDDTETPEPIIDVDPEEVAINRIKDSLFVEFNKAKPVVKTREEIKEALKAKGFKIYDYIDKKSQDTILLQQYFIAFFKEGVIRGQNEEESIEFQNKHWDYLSSMYNKGYVDISGAFVDESKYFGITIYNVATKDEAERLANEDPMVKAGRLDVDVHPWWVAKGRALR